MSTTTDTNREIAVYIGGPHDRQTETARAGHRWACFRSDDGEPLSARQGWREFDCLKARPPRRWYIGQAGYQAHAWIHASVWPLWQAVGHDERAAIVRHHLRFEPVALAAQPDRRAGRVAAQDALRANPRPGWDLAS
jgi:hypothetical protein